MAFWVFIAIFCGGLLAITMGMFVILVTLIRRNRKRSGS